MSRKEDMAHIVQLKKDLKAADKTRNYRLLELTLVMILLAIVAAFMYGRIQL